jgi:hypothetical protein
MRFGSILGARVGPSHRKASSHKGIGHRFRETRQMYKWQVGKDSVREAHLQFSLGLGQSNTSIQGYTMFGRVVGKGDGWPTHAHPFISQMVPSIIRE